MTPHWHNRRPLIQQAEVHHSPLDSILATKQVGFSWNRTQDLLMMMHHSTISLNVLKKNSLDPKKFHQKKILFEKKKKKRNNHETEKTESESISEQQQ